MRNDLRKIFESRCKYANEEGKSHYNIMRAIWNMESPRENVNQSKFALVDYTDHKGEKRSKNLLKTRATQQYSEAWSEARNVPSSDLVRVTSVNGGGTWMHEDVALEFACWLSL